MSKKIEFPDYSVCSPLLLEHVSHGSLIVNETSLCVTHDFWISTSCVTQAQWKSILGFNPSANDSNRRAESRVNSVSWLDAVAFCAELSRQYIHDGLRIQLPTIAEWMLWFVNGSSKFNGTAEWCLDQACDLSSLDVKAKGTAWIVDAAPKLRNDGHIVFANTYRPLWHKDGNLGFRVCCFFES